MEFSFFLLFTTILLGILYQLTQKLVGLAAGKGKMKWAVRIKGHQHRFWIDLLAFGIILICFCWLYLRKADGIWAAFSNDLENALIHARLAGKTRLMDGFYVGYFFRNYFPALIAFTLYLGFGRAVSGKRWTFWYRLYRGFDQKISAVLIAVWAGFGLVEITQWKIKEVNVWAICLNLAIFVSLFYSLFGFLTLVYNMKRSKVPYWLSRILIFGLLVFSGQVFIVTLALLMGVGITDIWMDYRRLYKRIR